MWGWKHGLGEQPETLHVPAFISGLPANLHTRIAAGRVHSLIATTAAEDHLDDLQQSSNDVLYALGNGQNGRLGLASSESASQPEVVYDLEGLVICDVACGHDHSLVLACNPT